MGVFESAVADDRVFEGLYRSYAQNVFRYALAVLGQQADAEDVTQTTFMNAYRALRRGERPSAAGQQRRRRQLHLLDLWQGGNGSPGNSTLADWMENGYDQEMPLGIYTGAPGADFNGANFLQALRDRVGTEVLFPVYQPSIVLSGSNAQFNVVGWVGFQITGYNAKGDSGSVSGSFTRFIAHGIQSSDPNDQSDFGVRALQLTQ